MAVSNHSNLLYTIYLVALVCTTTIQYPAAVAEAASVTPNEIPVVSPAVRAVTTMAGPCISMPSCFLYSYSSMTGAPQLCPLRQTSNVSPLTLVSGSELRPTPPLLTEEDPQRRKQAAAALLQETTAPVKYTP